MDSKVITDEEADDAIELLIRYCKEQRCKGCRFYEYYKCGIIALFPLAADLHGRTKEESV